MAISQSQLPIIAGYNDRANRVSPQHATPRGFHSLGTRRCPVLKLALRSSSTPGTSTNPNYPIFNHDKSRTIKQRATTTAHRERQQLGCGQTAGDYDIDSAAYECAGCGTRNRPSRPSPRRARPGNGDRVRQQCRFSQRANIRSPGTAKISSAGRGGKRFTRILPLTAARAAETTFARRRIPRPTAAMTIASLQPSAPLSGDGVKKPGLVGAPGNSHHGRRGADQHEHEWHLRGDSCFSGEGVCGMIGRRHGVHHEYFFPFPLGHSSSRTSSGTSHASPPASRSVRIVCGKNFITTRPWRRRARR